MITIQSKNLFSYLFLLLISLTFIVKGSFAANDASSEEEDSAIDVDAEEILAGKNFTASVYALGRLTNNPLKEISNGGNNDVTIDVLNLLNEKAEVLNAQGVILTPSLLLSEDKKLSVFEDFQSRQIVRNISNYVFNREVAPLGNETVHYKFVVDLEPGSYGLGVLLTVKFKSDERISEDGKKLADYKTQTLIALLTDVTIVDTSSLFDLQSIGIYILGLLIAGSYFYLNFGKNKLIKNVKKKTAAQVTADKKAGKASVPQSKEDIREEWIPDHIKEHSKKSGKKGNGR